ncbi:MAG: hypothetical protein V9G12_14710 [Microthrixaceae bacterium]
MLEPDARRQRPLRDELQFFTQASADIANGATTILHQRPARPAKVAEILERLRFLFHVVGEEPHITFERHLAQTAVVPKIGIPLEIRIERIVDLREGLVDVPHVVIGFQREHGAGIDLAFVQPADDGPPIVPPLSQAGGIVAGPGAAGLARSALNCASVSRVGTFAFNAFDTAFT